MESKFTKQLSNYCRLNFSNQIIRQPKALLCPKNLPAKPISFRKKCQKKSLKSFGSDRLLIFKKNPQKQCTLHKKQSLKQIDQRVSILNRHKSNHKIALRFENKNESFKHSNDTAPQERQKLHKSLEREPVRVREEPQRNVIDELKNYQNTNKILSFKTEIKNEVKRQSKTEHFIQTPPNNNVIYKSVGNLYRPNFVQVKHINIPEDKKLISSAFIFKKQPSIPASPVYSMIQPEKIVITPAKNDHYTKQNDCSIQEYIVQTPQVIQSSITYSQKFKKIYGEYDLSDQIKKDLMTSIELQPVNSKIDKELGHKPSYIKSPQSEGSTILPSQSKFRKIISDGEYFQVSRKVKSGQHETQKDFLKVRTDERNSKNDDQWLKPYLKPKDQEARVQNVRQQEQADDQNSEYTGKQRQNFRSFISVRSEIGSSSSSSEDSIIINNHPQEAISSKPIKTLF